MISSKELRIGNYIYGITDRVEIVDAISEDELKTHTPKLEDYHWDELKYYNPIPLTEEWLLKLGMVNNSNEWEKRHEEINFIIERFNNKYYYTGGEGVILSKPMNYLHELQNLCYAITGKDLTA